MTQELFNRREAFPVTVLVVVKLSPPLPGGYARLEIVFKSTVSVSQGALWGVLIGIDQTQESLGMTTSCLELGILGLEAPW